MRPLRKWPKGMMVHCAAARMDTFSCQDHGANRLAIANRLALPPSAPGMADHMSDRHRLCSGWDDRRRESAERKSGISLSLVRAHRTHAKIHQSIGWTDLSVTNLVISSSKKECWLASNSLRDTFALTRPMVEPFKNSTDLIEI